MSKNAVYWMVGMMVLTVLLVPVDIFASGTDMEGSWLGKLEVGGGASLRIVFNILQAEDGSLRGTMDSPDQGAKGIPVSKMTLEGDKFFLEIKSASAIYEGTVNAAGTEMTGFWKQGMAKLPLNLQKQVGPVVNNRPQEPVKPYPYLEREVTYENTIDNVRLAGTLTLPKTGGPFPAVLLITGSGAQDRDETILGHKPFLVIADYLTRQGIAVLRVDDRGVGGSTGNMMTATSADFAKDVQAGVDFLRGLPEIDPKQIGLIGHSEGGLIAPMVAVDNPEIAFIVLLAGPGLPGAKIIEMQVGLIAEVSGASKKEAQEAVRMQEEIHDLILQNPDDAVAAEKLREYLRIEIDKLSSAEKQGIGNVDQYIDQTVQMVLLPWQRYFLGYDPRPALQKVKCPVLALNGSKDIQVPAKENLREIEKALKVGQNQDYTVMELPGLNHLFQTAKTGAVAEYGEISETFSPEALQVMGSWILKHVTLNQ